MGLGFHVGAEDGVDAGLVTFAALFEPLHHIVVHADGEAVFRFGRGSLAVAQNDLPSLGISEKSISESRRARKRLKSVAPLEREREVVCVVLPFIAIQEYQVCTECTYGTVAPVLVSSVLAEAELALSEAEGAGNLIS